MITVTNLKYLQLKDTLPHKNMQSFLYLFYEKLDDFDSDTVEKFKNLSK